MRRSGRRLLALALALPAALAACRESTVDAAPRGERDEPTDHATDYVTERSHTGARLARGRLVGGLREGPWVTWYEDGALRWEGEYRAGLLEGIERGWRPGGALWFEGERRNGLREGLHRSWYDNGALEWEANYLGDLRHGVCRRLDIDGRLDPRQSGLYEHGVRVRDL